MEGKSQVVLYTSAERDVNKLVEVAEQGSTQALEQLYYLLKPSYSCVTLFDNHYGTLTIKNRTIVRNIK